MDGETQRRNWSPDQRQEALRGLVAISKIAKTHKDILGAQNVPGLGLVDFRWAVGTRGMQQIFATHKIARRIPIILARGKLTLGSTRAFVEFKGHLVVLSDNIRGVPTAHWVLTGYRKSQGIKKEGDR
jgi:hypothetical protein